jgi:hypothetical protein
MPLGVGSSWNALSVRPAIAAAGLTRFRSSPLAAHVGTAGEVGLLAGGLAVGPSTAPGVDRPPGPWAPFA